MVECSKRFTEVGIMTPFAVTPAVANTAERLLAVPYRYVFSFIIRVRTMGTATYVRIGTDFGQTYSLTVVGQTFQWAGNPGQVCDLAKISVISDTADATIEVIADYVPVYQTTQVNTLNERGI